MVARQNRLLQSVSSLVLILLQIEVVKNLHKHDVSNGQKPTAPDAMRLYNSVSCDNVFTNIHQSDSPILQHSLGLDPKITIGSCTQDATSRQRLPLAVQ